jgi:hypothetical protein
MIHFTKFATDKDFAEWQFKNNFNIIQIQPIVLGGAGTSQKDHRHLAPGTEHISQEFEHGVMVTYSENKSLEKSQTLACILVLKDIVSGYEKSYSLLPIAAAKLIIKTYEERNALIDMAPSENVNDR